MKLDRHWNDLGFGLIGMFLRFSAFGTFLQFSLLGKFLKCCVSEIVINGGPVYLELFRFQAFEIFPELVPGSVGVSTRPLALRHTPERSEYSGREKVAL